MHTQVCDLFGIRHPILNAPMGGGGATGELAAAVSGAGGLGLIGGSLLGDDRLRAWIRQARYLTDRPFGVGLISHLPDAAGLQELVLGEGVRIVAHSFADPTPFVGPAHDAGALLLSQVRTVAEAERSAEAGADVVVAQGTEAGGHTGEVSTLPLVPAVVDAVAPVPVLAAGGIGDARGIAAALLLGADGVWMGTRFLATPEGGLAAGQVATIIEAGTGDTVFTDVLDVAVGLEFPTGVHTRLLRNGFTDEWHGREDELARWPDERRLQFLAEELSDADRGVIVAGEVSGLVDAVEGAGPLVERLAAETDALLRDRPARLLGPD